MMVVKCLCIIRIDGSLKVPGAFFWLPGLDVLLYDAIPPISMYN
jgi:hypothetical protein